MRAMPILHDCRWRWALLLDARFHSRVPILGLDKAAKRFVIADFVLRIEMQMIEGRSINSQSAIANPTCHCFFSSLPGCGGCCAGGAPLPPLPPAPPPPPPPPLLCGGRCD